MKNSELATVMKSNMENFNQKLPKQWSIPSKKENKTKPKKLTSDIVMEGINQSMYKCIMYKCAINTIQTGRR